MQESIKQLADRLKRTTDPAESLKIARQMTRLFDHEERVAESETGEGNEAPAKSAS
jgi:hypothetical protein